TLPEHRFRCSIFPKEPTKAAMEPTNSWPTPPSAHGDSDLGDSNDPDLGDGIHRSIIASKADPRPIQQPSRSSRSNPLPENPSDPKQRPWKNRAASPNPSNSNNQGLQPTVRSAAMAWVI
ncbi:hypothetical protein ACLOJK_004877, partial [Asimina triloba]